MTRHKGPSNGTSSPSSEPLAREDRVLVTGASGAVGHFLVAHLLEKGYSVTALDLEGSHFPEGDPKRLTVLERDLTAPGVPEEAVKGARFVIHAAAIVDISRSWEELAPVNYYATKKLFEAAKAANVEHFVFFSTGSVYPGGPKPMTEDSEVRPANDYVRTKLESEKYLINSAPPPTVNILRPALIYGPWGKVLAGSLATVPTLLKLFTRHVPPLLGGPKSNWVHAEDVARAAIFLIENPQPHGSIFNVAGDEASSVGDVFTTAFEVGGLKLLPFGLPFPTQALRLLLPLLARDSTMEPINFVGGLLFNMAARKANINTPLKARLDKEAFDFAVRDMIFDNSRLKSLGFQYLHNSFKEGWRKTYEWYRQNRWVPE